MDAEHGQRRAVGELEVVHLEVAFGPACWPLRHDWRERDGDDGGRGDQMTDDPSHTHCLEFKSPKLGSESNFIVRFLGRANSWLELESSFDGLER